MSRRCLLKKLSEADNADSAKNGAKPPPHRGVLLLSIAIFTAVSASAVTFPFMQACARRRQPPAAPRPSQRPIASRAGRRRCARGSRWWARR